MLSLCCAFNPLGINKSTNKYITIVLFMLYLHLNLRVFFTHPQEFNSNVIQLSHYITFTAMDLIIPIAITIWATFNLLAWARACIIRTHRMTDIWISISSQNPHHLSGCKHFGRTDSKLFKFLHTIQIFCCLTITLSLLQLAMLLPMA